MPVMIAENTSLDYDVRGEGPPLVLINGLGFGRWAWFKQLPALTRHFSTITFDVRGERDLRDGVADLADDVVALLDHLGVRKAHVLGTSLGGFVAQKLALDRPDLVDRLVLVCTSYGGNGPERMSPKAMLDMIGLALLEHREGRPQGPRGRDLRRLPRREARGVRGDHALASRRLALLERVLRADERRRPLRRRRRRRAHYLPDARDPRRRGPLRARRERRGPGRSHTRRQAARPGGRRSPGLYRAGRRRQQGGRHLPQASKAPQAGGSAPSGSRHGAQRRTGSQGVVGGSGTGLLGVLGALRRRLAGLWRRVTGSE